MGSQRTRDTLGGIVQRLLGSESKWTNQSGQIKVDRHRKGESLDRSKPHARGHEALHSFAVFRRKRRTNRRTRPKVPAKHGHERNHSTGDYVIRAGDTLSTIARTTYGNSKHWQKICAANKNSIGNYPANLKVGMQLTIPAQDAIAGVRSDS